MKVVKVTPAQVAAAKLLIEMNDERGVETEPAVYKIANAKPEESNMRDIEEVHKWVSDRVSLLDEQVARLREADLELPADMLESQAIAYNNVKLYIEGSL